jgi:hypothetical protein
MCSLPAFMLRERDRFVGFDADARAYILAVENADGQRLEAAVMAAMNDFVVGCKTDSLWTALESSLLLAGPRTLAGILIPLTGPAPTNENFVSGDYLRKTGLIGNRTNKRLNTNYAHNAAPQNNRHLSVYVSQRVTSNSNERFAGTANVSGASQIAVRNDANTDTRLRSCSSATYTGGSGRYTGFHGISRAASGSFSRNTPGITTSVSDSSQTPTSANINVFSGGNGAYTSVRLAFYSAGRALNLPNLKTRVDNYISALASVLP